MKEQTASDLIAIPKTLYVKLMSQQQKNDHDNDELSYSDKIQRETTEPYVLNKIALKDEKLQILNDNTLSTYQKLALLNSVDQRLPVKRNAPTFYSHSNVDNNNNNDDDKAIIEEKKTESKEKEEEEISLLNKYDLNNLYASVDNVKSATKNAKMILDILLNNGFNINEKINGRIFTKSNLLTIIKHLLTPEDKRKVAGMDKFMTYLTSLDANLEHLILNPHRRKDYIDIKKKIFNTVDDFTKKKRVISTKRKKNHSGYGIPLVKRRTMTMAVDNNKKHLFLNDKAFARRWQKLRF